MFRTDVNSDTTQYTNTIALYLNSIKQKHDYVPE